MIKLYNTIHSLVAQVCDNVVSVMDALAGWLMMNRDPRRHRCDRRPQNNNYCVRAQHELDQSKLRISKFSAKFSGYTVLCYTMYVL